jgi:trypsin
VQRAVQIFHNGDLVCGGTLIASQYIVTAGHCFFEQGKQRKVAGFTVYVGDHRLGYGESHTIASYTRPKMSTGPRPDYADIAVAKLTDPVHQANQIAALGDQVPPTNANVAVKGWGHVGDMKVATMRVTR